MPVNDSHVWREKKKEEGEKGGRSRVKRPPLINLRRSMVEAFGEGGKERKRKRLIF